MKSKICNLRLLGKDGFIQVSIKGTSTSYFDVTYTLNGKQIVYVSPEMQSGKVQKRIIPNKSKAIKFRAFVKNKYNQWCQIYIREFKDVPKICFTIVATFQQAACLEMPCSNIYPCTNICKSGFIYSCK